MTKQKKLLVATGQTNMRLDNFVAEQMAISRSQAQKLISKNLVTINGKLPKKAGDQLKAGYAIEIIEATGAEKKAASKSKEVTAKAQRLLLEPKIIAETTDYIVIEKPSGLLTHPTMAGETVSVANWAAKKYPEIKKVGDDPTVRPGIVHRLDKEASGIMVIARTQKMFNHLKEQFKNRTIEKEYFALVHDPVERNWDELNFPLARSESADRMAARPLRSDQVGLDEGEKEAKTEFFLEKQFVNYSLLRVIIHTGRMHQIRVHFLAYNHPLVGDPLYFQKKRKRSWDEKLGRLFLHSTKLSFTDLAGQKVTFESPLPQELETFLTLLA